MVMLEVAPGQVLGVCEVDRHLEYDNLHIPCYGNALKNFCDYQEW